jgi:hypothetical protein
LLKTAGVFVIVQEVLVEGTVTTGTYSLKEEGVAILLKADVVFVFVQEVVATVAFK